MVVPNTTSVMFSNLLKRTSIELKQSPDYISELPDEIISKILLLLGNVVTLILINVQ